MRTVAISVIVPVYNGEKYLEQCIQSILNQSFQDFELLIIDDGSEDNSGIICDDYCRKFNKKVRVIHKENQGVLAARCDGIRQAIGQYCVFVDSDDFIETEMLGSVYNYIQQSEADVLLYSFQYYKNGKEAERFRSIAEDGSVWTDNTKRKIYEKVIFSSDINAIWAKAIRTSILKEDTTDYTKYYGKNMAEDLLQSLYPLTVAKKIVYMDKVLYNYRINEDGVSRSFRPETIAGKNTIHVYQKILEYLPIWGMDNSEIKEKLDARWFNDAMHTMSKYYENAASKRDRDLIIDYNWETILPQGVEYSQNKYANAKYKQLYSLINGKRNRAVRFFFFKRRCNYLIREWKKGIKRCIYKKT